MGAIIDLIFGCRHRRITRPITPVHKTAEQSDTYVACLDCGKQFRYDIRRMRIGAPLPRPARDSGDKGFQPSN